MTREAGTMRTGTGDIWQGLAHGMWLAHDRRMRLLDVAGDLRLAAQIEAGAARKHCWVQSPGAVCDRLHRFLSRCCRSWFAIEWRVKVEQWKGGDAVRDRIRHA
jgi:hypothetical protein